jgi:hypothetical protein
MLKEMRDKVKNDIMDLIKPYDDETLLLSR